MIVIALKFDKNKIHIFVALDEFRKISISNFRYAYYRFFQSIHGGSRQPEASPSGHAVRTVRDRLLEEEKCPAPGESHQNDCLNCKLIKEQDRAARYGCVYLALN
jgi:hypothetical protein